MSKDFDSWERITDDLCSCCYKNTKGECLKAHLSEYRNSCELPKAKAKGFLLLRICTYANV